jgi:hypothetical protein
VTAEKKAEALAKKRRQARAASAEANGYGMYVLPRTASVILIIQQKVATTTTMPATVVMVIIVILFM